ncbi:MAG: asparaginase domain-containing protein [Treponema sp.]|nr:asparaginase domain-containing protein [Treponema sp.]
MILLKSYISLDVRILLLSGSKAFCPCTPEQSCPVCGEDPRAGLPVPNAQALRKAYLLVHGLGGVPGRSAAYERNEGMARPAAGPAISRLSLKLGTGAFIDIMFHRRRKRIRIGEIRLEEDAGRLIRHPQGNAEARMDYSRAGMPSLRIRTEDDFEIGEETSVFLAELRRRLQYLEILPAELPLESVVRCNAYVALATYPEKPSVYVKLRNLNSFNFVSKAVNTELSRQENILSAGGNVTPESRLWNEAKNLTESYRAGGGSLYRPVEGLAPFSPDPLILETLNNFTPELPGERRDRFVRDWELTTYQAEFICDERSRADYFEKAVSLGADPKEAAGWMASWVFKELRRLKLSLAASPLDPRRFAAVLSMLKTRRIHGGMAKRIITAVLEEDREPEHIVKERNWEQLTDREALQAVVKSVVQANPGEVRRIREGDAGPIRYLTGLVMKATNGLAEPVLVKDLLKDELSVSLVYVLSLGGAISGRIGDDGVLEPGDETVLKELLADQKTKVRHEPVQVGRLLSEEIVPSDWAVLIETIAEKLASGTANGIVVTHGTDTLPYTAPLIYWLFAGANAPIVLAASSTPPGVSTEAARTMKKAVSLALGKQNGVYVVHGGRVLSPLNLKFERIGGDCFRNWNMAEPVFDGEALLTGPLEADRYVLSQLLEEAVNSMCIFRIYPGLRSDYLLALMDKGVKTFFLELFDTGTAGFREGPYSLKRVLAAGKRRGARFYCTSQQEGIVDFSGYVSSKELWKEGAVPMGALTTETAVARFLAASIIADSEEELVGLMEAERGFTTSEEGSSVFDF